MADDLGPLPTIHHRHNLVEKARNELLAFLIDWRERHGLTRAEDLSLLVDVMRSDLQSAVVSERRMDRTD